MRDLINIPHIPDCLGAYVHVRWGPGGPTESKSQADIKTAQTWNVCLKPNTDSAADGGKHYGSEMFDHIFLKLLAD